MTHLDSDRALVDEVKDQFGFTGIAKKLAPSIVEASKGDGMVIGLEGKWGSGKTSLLNFLQAELKGSKEANVYTISIAPWLNGDSSPLVLSLLQPMSKVLEQIEVDKQNACQPKWKLWNSNKKQVTRLSQLLKNYGPQTLRKAAVMANFSGNFFPGIQALGSALDKGADIADQFISENETPTELKQQISQKLQALDVGFVVMLDDLDRLEPEQAVEVVRLVRSVADFPKVVYLMCYDREVLAHALEAGLKVSDGDLFLQKVVQLTFTIPLPEPFDLRNQFLLEAKSVYFEVNNIEMGAPELDDLKKAVDREGMWLTTPREVKIALNGIRFVYPQVKRDMYFPDFCRLQLIKTTRHGLYKWLERYLSERSVLVTGDASISPDERKKIGDNLKELLPNENLIRDIGQYVPGVVVAEEPENCVFGATNETQVSSYINLKRLGSPLHYRFYFALTGPKTVMSDSDFLELLELAKSDFKFLSERFSSEVMKRRSSGKTWFEHVLDRLDEHCILRLEEQQLVGIIQAISDMMDIALHEDGEHRPFSRSLAQIANNISNDCLKQLRNLSIRRQEEVVKHIVREGRAINWIVGHFIRRYLFQHGIVGDRKKPEEEWEITDNVLSEALGVLKKRLSLTETKEQILGLPDIDGYLYGWDDISQDGQAKLWVEEYAKSDEGFITILGHLRSWVMSERVYYPLKRDVVERFFNWKEVESRLDAMKQGDYSKQVAELNEAIKLASYF